jgi:putative ABC transport system permease protein
MSKVTIPVTANFQENLGLALGTINAHKMRSALTILGVVIGVTCVIAIGAILTGMDRSFVENIEGFGTNNVFVQKFNMGPRFGRMPREERMRKPISWEDFEAVRDSCTACRQATVAIFHQMQVDIAKYKGEQFNNCEFMGGLPNFPDVFNMPVRTGRMFTDAENRHSAPVAVIGYDVVKTLFPNEDPIGKVIEVNGKSFEVIGTFEKKKAGAFGDNSQDRNVTVPYGTYHKLYPQAKDHLIIAQSQTGKIDLTVDQVREALRRSRRVPYREADSFGMATASSFIEQFHAITGATALVMVVISSIGLLVGGVGVMNIMLVSVTERTREIGVRKAIGARRRDIILQFLLEAATLTGMGGLAGILLGYLITLIINFLLPTLPAAVPLWGVILGFAVSVGVGLFFGLWPAVKASRLDPVEALRYE